MGEVAGSNDQQIRNTSFRSHCCTTSISCPSGHLCHESFAHDTVPQHICWKMFENFKDPAIIRRAQPEPLLNLCDTISEKNILSVLLPEVRQSGDKLPQILKILTRHKGNDKLVFEILEACRQDSSIKLSAASYTLGMSACAKSKSWQRAMLLFHTISMAQLLPNVFSYSVGITACEKGTQWTLALILFEAMPKAEVQPRCLRCFFVLRQYFGHL